MLGHHHVRVEPEAEAIARFVQPFDETITDARVAEQGQPLVAREGEKARVRRTFPSLHHLADQWSALH